LFFFIFFVTCNANAALSPFKRYLALDMQFTWFLAAPGLLVYAYKGPLVARKAVLIALFASMGAGFVYSLVSGISANSFDGAWVTL
jgi:hypothetical protein